MVLPLKHDYKKTYSDFLTLLCKLASQPGYTILIDDRLRDGQVLTVKLLRHLLSIWRLKDVHDAEEFGFPASDYIDHSSINVLTRAALETFLVYDYLFGKPDRPDAIFRYHRWQLGGLMDRQEIIGAKAEDLIKKAYENTHIEELRKKIEQSPFFAAYKKNQQPKILQGDWRLGKHWWQIAQEAGVDKQYFDAVYSHLCGYSHSSFNSTIQMQSAASIEDLDWLSNAALSIGVTIMAHFAQTYSLNVPSAARYLKTHAESQALIDRWISSEPVAPSSWHIKWAAVNIPNWRQKTVAPQNSTYITISSISWSGRFE